MKAFMLVASILIAACTSVPPQPPSLKDGFLVGDKSTVDRPVIVFVHGLGGDTNTWLNETSNVYWPALLPIDNQRAFEQADVFVYKYDANILKRAKSIASLAESLHFTLKENRVAERKRIVFVMHSLGGLVTRALIVGQPDYMNRIQMLYFYGTPTNGSNLANVLSMVSLAIPGGVSTFARQLNEMQNDDYLAQLETAWINARLFRIPSYCAYETKPVAGVALVVPLRSAASLCTYAMTPIDEDHFGIVKPNNDRHVAYQALRQAYIETKRPLQPDSTQLILTAIADVSHRLDQATRAIQPAMPTTDKKLGTELASIDPGKEIYLQLRLFPGDVVRVMEPSRNTPPICFVSAKDQTKRCLDTNNRELEYDAKGEGASVIMETSNEPTANPTRLAIAYKRYAGEPRFLAAPVPLTEVSVKSPTISLPSAPTNRGAHCDAIRAKYDAVVCRELSDQVIRVSHRTSFSGGKIQSKDIGAEFAAIGKAIAELGWGGEAKIYGSASADAFSCNKAGASINSLELRKAIAPEVLLTAKNGAGKIIFDERVICSDRAKTGTVTGNYLLRFARAAWVAEQLEEASKMRVIAMSIAPEESDRSSIDTQHDDNRVRVSADITIH